MGQDNKGPRTFSTFLIKFSELAPRLMLKQMSLLLGQLDSDAYIGAVEVIGAIIQDLADVEEDESSDGPEESVRQGRLCLSSRPLTRLASSDMPPDAPNARLDAMMVCARVGCAPHLV
ncbi:hypothetical protein B0H14DRAFT_3855905 [Mycena olivaceomarginata]|nr:hypothetical protein B0H14DRAFT_3855905 [Mycena olivaceomarginata]